MMKRFIVWTLAALILVAAYAIYLVNSDAKADCEKQQFVRTKLCATIGS